MSQHKVPVPITRYMVNDKPLADWVFQILNACGKKAEVVKIAAIKPMYSGFSILDYNIHNFIRHNDHLFGGFAVQIGSCAFLLHYSSLNFIFTKRSGQC